MAAIIKTKSAVSGAWTGPKRANLTTLIGTAAAVLAWASCEEPYLTLSGKAINAWAGRDDNGSIFTPQAGSLPVLGYGNPIAISSISYSGTTLTVNLAAALSYAASDRITVDIAGSVTTAAAINGTFLANVVDSDTLSMTLATSPGTLITAGTVAVAKYGPRHGAHFYSTDGAVLNNALPTSGPLSVVFWVRIPIGSGSAYRYVFSTGGTASSGGVPTQPRFECYASRGDTDGRLVVKAGDNTNYCRVMTDPFKVAGQAMRAIAVLTASGSVKLKFGDDPWLTGTNTGGGFAGVLASSVFCWGKDYGANSWSLNGALYDGVILNADLSDSANAALLADIMSLDANRFPLI